MHTGVRRSQWNEVGQSVVEFALILPVLLTLIFGIMEAGRAFYVYTAVANAVREGSRYAATDPTNTTAIKNTVVGGAVGVGLTTTNVSVLCSPCTSNNPIQVSVTFTFRPVVPLMFPSLTMDSVSTVDIE